jgi:predicted ArsR family transcriptional regulator
LDETVDVRSSRPRVRQRERVLGMVREHGGAIDATEVAAQLRVHVSTARFHLDGLCREGLVERTRLTRVGVGRPRTGYRAVEGLDYSVLAGVFAVGLGQTAQTRAHRAQRAGREWARRMPDLPTVGDSGDVDPQTYLEHRTRIALGLFRRLGFAPALAEPSGQDDSERVIRLTACPVRNLARSHPESVCGVHLGLLQGLVDDAKPAGRRTTRHRVSARIEPFVGPDVCIATLVAQS